MLQDIEYPIKLLRLSAASCTPPSPAFSSSSAAEFGRSYLVEEFFFWGGAACGDTREKAEEDRQSLRLREVEFWLDGLEGKNREGRDAKVRVLFCSVWFGFELLPGRYFGSLCKPPPRLPGPSFLWVPLLLWFPWQ